MSWPFIYVAALQTASTQCPTEIFLRFVAGSSPRKSGSLLMEGARSVASLQTASAQYPTRDIAALDAGSSPRKPGSLLREVAQMVFKSLLTALVHHGNSALVVARKLFFYDRFRFNLYQHFRRNQL
jgi:hypothetical protein